jgi:hypothetical protein
MARLPSDAAKTKVLAAFARMEFRLIRERNYLHLELTTPDGNRIPLTLPNHPSIKGSTLRMACTQAKITRAEFLRAYLES